MVRITIKKQVFLILFTWFSLLCKGQTYLEFNIYDADTKVAISDVHVFLANSTIGTVSDQLGYVTISIPNGTNTDLMLTHLSYDAKSIGYSQINSLQQVDSVFLSKSSIDLSAVTISAMSKRKWKKNLKKFKAYFLGEDKLAYKCKILNPEVLHFQDTSGVLTASATDLIQIQNEYLGYKVDFLLLSFAVSKNESSYSGKAFFTDISSDSDKDYDKKREAVFKNSSRHFYTSLIDDRLSDEKYKVLIRSYNNGNFTTVFEPTASNLIIYDTLADQHRLVFSDYLEITNKRSKKVVESSVGKLSNLEASKFGGAQSGNGGSSRMRYDVSYLYKNSVYLTIDRYGNVINPQNLKEYGTWANQRVAHLLPWDYGQPITSKQDSSKPNPTLSKEKPPLSKEVILSLLSNDRKIQNKAIKQLDSQWDMQYTAPILEVLRMTSDDALSNDLLTLLQTKLGKENIPNYYDGIRWVWSIDPCYPEYLADLKGDIYQYVDPAFKTYFEDRQSTAQVRVDEILWGGVKQDGIPPLRHPKMIDAKDADYLNGGDIIFGMNINGIPRAYPKRILAWHEFFVDTFDTTDIAGVYCTLCGTVVAYDMTHDGVRYDLGTSGFLYRSNKLMYDKNTSSLWNTITGKPVMGPLVYDDIELPTYPVITTTWDAWKKQYPDSQVLSIDTGYDRDYSEGEAYKEYFASDELMFPVPKLDNRLHNKDEVLVIKARGYENNPVAISIDFIRKQEIYSFKIDTQDLVAISMKDGSARVYQRGNQNFKSRKQSSIYNDEGEEWLLQEAMIKGPNGETLERIPTHRSFWFAWFNMFPDTRLIK